MFSNTLDASASRRRSSTRPTSTARRCHPTEHEGAVHRDDRQPVRRDRRHRGTCRCGPLERPPSGDRSTFSTPALCRPMGGAPTSSCTPPPSSSVVGTLGGVVTEAGTFDWGSGRFANMTEPVPTYNDLAGGTISASIRISPSSATITSEISDPRCSDARLLVPPGTGDLDHRMAGHVERLAVAAWLEADARGGSTTQGALIAVSRHGDQNLPGRARRRVHLRPGRWPSCGPSFIESLEMISHLANVGDAKTLILHPASTTHSQLTDEQMRAGAVSPDMVRISVGLEDLDDILYDLDVPWRLPMAERVAVPWVPPSALQRKRILDDTRSIAIVGASANLVAREQLRGDLPAEHCEGLHPVSRQSTRDRDPRPTRVSVAAGPSRGARHGRRVPPQRGPSPIAQEAVELGSKTFWAQLGLWSAEAAQIASAAGLDVVWIAARRSNTHASLEVSTSPDSTRASSPPGGEPDSVGFQPVRQRCRSRAW